MAAGPQGLWLQPQVSLAYFRTSQGDAAVWMCQGWARRWLNVGFSGVRLGWFTLQRGVSSVPSFKGEECPPENIPY